MSNAQLERHIRTIAKDTANVVFTKHAVRDSMRKRQVLDAEVFHCLRTGRIELQPEPDQKMGNLVCRMQCYGASRNLAVCVALDDAQSYLVVVTVIVTKH